jgi:hypothetical protein
VAYSHGSKAGQLDERRFSQSRLDMDAAWLEAHCEAAQPSEKGSSPQQAQNPQNPQGRLEAREGGTKARRAGQGGFRTYPRAQDRKASPAQASDDMGRQI